MNTCDGVVLSTARLLLRPWRRSDLEPFAALNGDREVMRHFPAPLTATQSDELAERFARVISEHGWGVWAVERCNTGEFIGITGLHAPTAHLPFSPSTEILWRLAHAHWGQGLATEAANAALRFGFEELELKTIVAYTAQENQRSRRVMEKLGMQCCGQFDHPNLPVSHPLAPHVWYEISRPYVDLT